MTNVAVQSEVLSEIASTEAQGLLDIVIIVTYAHPYVGSGLGVVAKFQAEYLASLGHRVTLVSSNIPRTARSFMLHGVTYIKVPAVAFLERLHIPVPLLFYNRGVIEAIRSADVVHVHDILYPSSFIAAMVAKLYKKRVVLTQHVPHVQYTNKIINAIEKIVFYTMGIATIWASDVAVVLNTSVYRWLRRYKRDVHLLANGVDHNLFSPSTAQEKQSIRAYYNLPSDKFIVLFVGRFVPKKGFDVLYNARDPSYLLVFVGGGIVPDSIQSDDMARIVGPLPQEELAMMYKACDAFILPSYGEGFPLSIQEAMATGLPIITSKWNTFDAVLDSPLITYIDVTEADIRAAIGTIQNSPTQQRAMSEASREIAREHFSWEKNGDYLEKLYKDKQTVHTRKHQ